MLGDGSTDAGAESLSTYLNDSMKDLSPDVKEFCLNQDKNKKILPCAFSRDEGYIRPSIVVALGKGHPSKGVHLLDNFIENVRAHKISNGNKLAPKAKSIKSYMEG